MQHAILGQRIKKLFQTPHVESLYRPFISFSIFFSSMTCNAFDRFFKHQFYVISKFISFIMEFSIMTIYVHVHMVLSHFSTSPFSRRDVTLVWPWNITCLPFALICMAIGDVMSQFPFKTEINNCANKIMSCDWYFYFSKPCVVWKNEKTQFMLYLTIIAC